MFAQLSHTRTARLLAALAVALTLGVGAVGGLAQPANADGSQWVRPQSNWGNTSGWKRHWRTQNQFGNRSQIVIGGGSGVIIARRNFNSGFIVSNPGFIVRQPAFIIGQPAFVVRQPNFVFARPQFALKQKQFFRRHPSLHFGKPWWHNNWSHKRWKHKRWKHQMGGMN